MVTYAGPLSGELFSGKAWEGASDCLVPGPGIAWSVPAFVGEFGTHTQRRFASLVLWLARQADVISRLDLFLIC